MNIIKHKYKQFLYIIIFFIFILAGLKVYTAIKSNSLHEHLSLDDVQSIAIRGYSNRIASPEETENIVNWFNSINNIQENPEFAGTTDSSSIQIKLKSGKSISIFYPAMRNQDFEIQRYNKKNKYISYWGKQSAIKEILEAASSK